MGKARATRWPSAQDLDLFHKVVADVTPLRPEPAPSTRPIVKGVEAKVAKKSKKSIVTLAPSSPSNHTPAVFPASLNDHGPGRTPGLDKRSALRLQRGKREIDGRIDLHGMTQTEARSALTAFVTNGHRHGCVAFWSSPERDAVWPRNMKCLGVAERFAKSEFCVAWYRVG